MECEEQMTGSTFVRHNIRTIPPQTYRQWDQETQATQSWTLSAAILETQSTTAFRMITITRIQNASGTYIVSHQLRIMTGAKE